MPSLNKLLRQCAPVTFSLLAWCPFAAGQTPQRSAVSAKPNVVVILADDLGWADVGYHDRRAKTPNIDALAHGGIELDRFTVAPMCSPTRAALLTGRYPIRFGLARSVIPPHRLYGIPPQERTLPERLAEAGYEHRGIFGKWHLGHLRPDWHPLSNGFTHFRGHYNGAIDYFTHERDGQRDWHVDWQPSDQAGYSTDLVAQAAADWVKQSAADDAPYFCYVAFNAPHAPYQAKPEDLARFANMPGDATAVDGPREGEGKINRQTKRLAAAAMIWSLDEGIGQIVEAIEASGEADNTIVWFASDNGGVGAFPNSNKPLRGAKLDVFEGGVRVPACVRWPARWPGGRKVAEAANCIDVLPTVLAAAGVSPDFGGDPNRSVDGVDLGGVLSGMQQGLPPRELYFYHGQGGPDQEKIAVATPDWKLVVLGPDLSEARGLTADHTAMLFRFPNDLLEKKDVAADHPEVVQQLAEKLIAFRELQPADGVPPYSQRDESFVPPPNWQLSPQ